MKKFNRFISLSVACVAMLSAAACNAPAAENTHTHTYGTDWKSDATKHWHAATCEHTDEKGDIDGHADANKDGVCDVCSYAGDHTHTYETEWSFNETNHWRAANCFHDVKADDAAHTADAMGDCNVCGYHVSDPTVDTVAAAVEMGVAMKDNVKAGTVEFDNGYGVTSTYYEFRADYTYVKQDVSEYYYSVKEDGEVLGVVKTWDSENWQYVEGLDYFASEDSMKGPEISNAIVGMPDGVYFYGVEELVSVLYEMGAKDNLNADFTENVEDGVYSFSFGYYVEYDGLYMVNVAFTLDEETYAFANVEVISDYYSTDSLVEKTPATEDAPATWEVAEYEMAWGSYVVEIEQSANSVANPFAPEEVTVTDYKIVNEYDEEVTSIEIEQNYATTLYFAEIMPETARIDFATVEFSGENVNTEEMDYDTWQTIGLVASFDYGCITLESTDEIDTTYELTISVNGVEKTINVKVVEPVPTNIEAGYVYINENDAPTFASVYAGIEMFVGDNVEVGAILDRAEDGYTVSVSPSVELGEGFEYAIWDEYTSTYADVVAYSLSNLGEGEYTITFTAVADDTLTASIVVTVKAVPTLKEIFNGMYKYDIYEGETMFGETLYNRVTVEFGTDIYFAENYAQGMVTITEAPVAVNPWFGVENVDTENATSIMCYFTYENGVFTLNDRFGGVVALDYQFNVKDNQFCIGLVSIEYDEMEKEEISAASEILGDWTYSTAEATVVGNFTVYKTYMITFNNDGTAMITYGDYFKDYSMWQNEANNVTYMVSYTLAETAEDGKYVIVFSAFPGESNEIPGFAIENACYMVETFDSISLVISGEAQTFTKA